MHFVTREHIHVDRIATAWTIRRFVDPQATFGFVPRNGEAPAGSVTFDLRGADLSHTRGRCTLDSLIEKYELTDEGLRRMAGIIRAADLPHEDPAPPEAAGILAIFDGIRDGSATDEERLQRGSVICDALYTYCARHADAGSAL